MSHITTLCDGHATENIYQGDRYGPKTLFRKSPETRKPIQWHNPTQSSSICQASVLLFCNTFLYFASSDCDSSGEKYSPELSQSELAKYKRFISGNMVLTEENSSWKYSSLHMILTKWNFLWYFVLSHKLADQKLQNMDDLSLHMFQTSWNFLYYFVFSSQIITIRIEKKID